MIQVYKKQLLWLAVLVPMVMTTLAVAERPKQPRAPGIESPDYVWNEMRGEMLQALRATGDPIRGEISFDVCAGCHGFGAEGEDDGSYPRLAGQHASVLIKQMTDVRAGRRDNPKMYPFAADHVITTQEVADIAVFLAALPVTPDNGKGPGSDLARGEELYRQDCESCHGAIGQGSGAKFYPRVSGQHYEYLLREARMIRDGERRNANPEMVEVIEDYSDADLAIVSDFMSRLPLE
ncbi:c-type cytochrome [Thioalkalicoccus limnaeus]|uniref:C-type cytochrome n=1 Tax=Thioalkalicoccus limnaeus TaxID=120681 RepID=A0ABV4BE46_9GAMM